MPGTSRGGGGGGGMSSRGGAAWSAKWGRPSTGFLLVSSGSGRRFSWTTCFWQPAAAPSRDRASPVVHSMRRIPGLLDQKPEGGRLWEVYPVVFQIGGGGT